jgi:hypothetical protein
MFPFNEDVRVVEHASVVVHRRPQAVFHFIGEQFFSNYPRWSSELQELKQITPGPVRVGTRARQVRIDLGHRSESVFAVTRFEPGRRICFEGVSCPYRCDYLIEEVASDGSSALLSFTFELKKLELYLRPFAGLIHRAILDGVGRTVGTLKFLVEAEDDPPQMMAAPPANVIGKSGPVMHA